jgi:hypothetical protein
LEILSKKTNIGRFLKWGADTFRLSTQIYISNHLLILKIFK